MNDHASDSVICRNGCQALWNITLNSKHIQSKKRFCLILFLTTANNKKKAGESGAIETIQEIMKIHINDKDICNIGCQALWNIATDSKHIQSKINICIFCF